MDPVKALAQLECQPLGDSSSLGKSGFEDSYTRVFSKRPLEEAVKQLYSPHRVVKSDQDETPPAEPKPRKVAASGGGGGGGNLKGVFRFERDKVARLCKSIEFQITPSDGELMFLDQALELLRSCIADMPGFSSADKLEVQLPPGKKDPELVFNHLLSKFFEYMDNEAIPEVRLEGEVDSMGPCADCDIASDASNEHEVVRQQLRSITLWCNWAFHLSEHTQTALTMAQSPLDTVDVDMILDTAVGIKESNRNMAFYSSVCTQLGALLKAKDSALDRFISTLMSKVQYIKQLPGTNQVVDSGPWKKLSGQLSAIIVHQNEIPFDDTTGGGEHLCNINSVRNEMRLRMDRKGYCDALSRECDMYTHEYNTLNSRRQAIAGRFEQIMRQIQDLVGPSWTDAQVDALKVIDARKMCPLLQHFLVRLHLRMLQFPNREVIYKVTKERDYVLQVSLLAPRDMLMPTIDTVIPTFPLVFVFYVDEGGSICVREPHLSISCAASFTTGSESSTVSTRGSPRTWPLTHDPYWGLEDFTLTTNELPPVFCDRLRSWYDTAHLHVWNNYYMDCYRRGKLEALHMLPHQLRKKHVSQYHVNENRWILSNHCASVKMKLEFNENLEPRCRFSEFEQKEILRRETTIELITILRKDANMINNSNVAEYLTDLNIDVLRHFGTRFRTVRLGVLLEAYAFLFDWLSSRRL